MQQERAEPYGLSRFEMFRNEPREGKNQKINQRKYCALVITTDSTAVCEHDILTEDYVLASNALKACTLQRPICVNLPVLQPRGKIF